MSYGFILLPLVPLRLTASDRAEMVSQLLFGETLEVLRREEKWSLVRVAADRYEGWLDNKQYRPLSYEEYAVVTAWPRRAAAPLQPLLVNHAKMAVPMGSPLPASSVFCMGSLLVQRPDDCAAKSGTRQRQGDGRAHAVPPAPCRAGEPQDLARQLIHAPYLWGGKSLMGIDCSGLVQVAFAVCGMQLPRNAAQQALMGTAVAAVELLQPNDLCFFCNEEGRIVHVGISIGCGQIIHASGSVRIDRIDAQGIFNAEEGRYTHRLHSLRRVF